MSASASRLIQLCTVLLLISAPVAANADAPVGPRTVQRASSPNGAFTVVSDPQAGTYVVKNPSGERLWAMPGWFASPHVSNNGLHVATVYEGLNLVPLDAPPTLEIITFWTKGKKVRAVTLGDIVPKRSILKRTTSHYAWGSVDGVNDRDELVVTRVDGQALRFDLASGVRR